MFRFTTRELVLVTVIVAMGVSWLMQQSRMRSKIEAAEDSARVTEYRLKYLTAVMQADGYTVTWVEGLYRLKMVIDPPLPPALRPNPRER